MYKEIKCLRCDKNLEFVKQEHWASGAVLSDIYVCPECGEIHFFKADDDTQNPDIELVKCTFCMKKYDKNYPHCPHCGKKLGEY